MVLLTPQHAVDIARATKKKKGCHREDETPQHRQKHWAPKLAPNYSDRAATVPRGVAGSSWESLKRKENYCGTMQHGGAPEKKLSP